MKNPSLIFATIGAATVLSVAVSCSTVRKRPCEEGGQPAREKPAPKSVYKKQCDQTLNKQSQKMVNDGKYREWYENGTLALEGEYKEGLKVGKWFEWDESGKQISERWFENGKETETRADKKPDATGKRSTDASGS